jgi:hypothetical protein
MAEEITVQELARAINAQARLLAEIVRAANHIVTSYAEITKVEEPHGEKKEAV